MSDTQHTPTAPCKALVTGGGGFLGRAVVEKLLDRGWSVRSFARSAYPELEALGVDVMRGDLVDPDAVARACQGCDIVFHVAAKAALWGPYEDFYAANVLGTENVIAACRKHNIQRLVHTSSPSVIFDGTDVQGVDESFPYPRRYYAHYPKTKALAEQRILATNNDSLRDDSLRTVALRPHLIWGPRDVNILPRLAARAKVGKLRKIGKADKLVDTTYVDNAADAHLLAADRLTPGSPVAGKAYFLSQDDPRPLWQLTNRFLAAAGAPPVTRSISLPLARAAGATFELVYSLLGIKSEPPLTRFLVSQLSTAHWFDISAAKRDLGYEPKISIDEGLERLAEWFRKEENV